MTKTETKSTVLVKHHLKQLKLPTMHSECEKTALRAAKENLDHLAYLLALCELELVDRERRAAERRLKAARFPTTKTLDEFDFDVQPSVNKRLVLELAKGDWIDQRENLLLVGAVGTGKPAQRNTPLVTEECEGQVTVTDPAHPLFGRTFQLAGMARLPGAVRYCQVHLFPNRLGYISVASTDLAPTSTGTSRLDGRGLAGVRCCFPQPWLEREVQ